MDPNLEALAGSLKDLIKGRTAEYLNEQKEKKEFLEERAKRLAELTIDYAKAHEADRPRIKAQMEIVFDTIQNELYAAAVILSGEARQTFKDVLGTVLDYGIKILPKLLAAV